MSNGALRWPRTSPTRVDQWTRAHALVTAWSGLMPRVDQEVVSLLTRAGEVATVALVSNATTRLECDLARQGLNDLADAVVNTARIGVAKPDPRVYLIAAERVGAPVHRCLFIDDTVVNVTAAREVGMAALHYRQLEDLRDALSHLLDTATPHAQGCDPRGHSGSSNTRRHHYASRPPVRAAPSSWPSPATCTPCTHRR
jgi:HAD superfamily hydrolase (TIGR01509 family)